MNILDEDSTVQIRTKQVQNAIDAVKAHCMCARFEENRTHYRVIYPEGYFPDGVQVAKGGGKHTALARLLIVMERHWKDSQL